MTFHEETANKVQGNRLHFSKIALKKYDRQMRMMKKKVDGGQSRVIYESINQTLWGCLKGKSEKYRCGHS